MNLLEKNSSLKAITVSALVLLLTASVIAPIASAAVLRPLTYGVFWSGSGVIESDRFDFMNADGNPLKEDIANAVFQGPGVFQRFKSPVWRNVSIYDDSIGFMKDVFLEITNYGTLKKMNYTGEETPPYHWLPVIEQNPPTNPQTDIVPLEGWLIAYNITVAPVGYDEGYLIVTFSGFDGTGKLVANVIGQDTNDNWAISVIERSIWVDNPRLLALFYKINATNLGSPFTPEFELDIVIVFNKATKFIEIFQNLKLVNANVVGCVSVRLNMALARMAIFDANPYCDRAFYGWKNVTIEDPEFFLVLSWTNETLRKWVRADLGYDYYAAYMASYPVPNSWAIASTWYDSNDTDTFVDAFNVWNATQLRFTPIRIGPQTAGWLANYTMLYMGDIDGDGKGDGDQALVRVEWYSDAEGMPEEVIGVTETGWKMVMYGVYDVNGYGYDGGEGGWFAYGYLCLSNGKVYESDLVDPENIVPIIFGVTLPTIIGAPPAPWIHTGTIGWLNWWAWFNGWDGLDTGVSSGNLTSLEYKLWKEVIYLDIDQDGNKDAAEDADNDNVTSADEYYIPFEWWPTEELWWQLSFKFAPPVFSKIPPSTCCLFKQWGPGQVCEGDLDGFGRIYDFVVLPSPGATPDAAGAAWLNARFTSWLVTFDVESYNMVATVGYINPGTKMLPYLMLRLEPIPDVVETYPERRLHYLTSDERALIQMEWDDLFPWKYYPANYGNGTFWYDKHYLLVSVAGVHPNLATYYFNDFSPIVRAIGGDYQWDIVVLPTTGPIDVSPFVGTNMGLGVIALAKDHFNNTALLVWGLDAQDTYWTAFVATWYWPFINASFGDWQALLISIDYTITGPDWGTGNGIPTAHPWYPPINEKPVWSYRAYAIEYESLP
ncbi:MAG: hypothetical protein QXN03_00185 [Desulfurococcaceae archaeon]